MMKNSIFYSIIFSTALLLLISCTSQTNSKDTSAGKDVDISVLLQEDTLHISSNSSKKSNFSLTLFDDKILSQNFTSSIDINVLEIIKKIDAKNEIAIYATMNSNSIPIRLKIENGLDTTILFQIKPKHISRLKGSIIGVCAPLISTELDDNVIKNTKRWLFRNNLPLSDSLVYNMVGVLHELNRTGNEEYITTSDIPVLKSFNNIQYRVNSNMIADHYILYACSSQTELEEFVEGIVADNFKLTKSSPNNITTCNKNENISGFNCIILIGINMDWSYQIQPLGIVAIDNIPPDCDIISSQSNNYVDKSNLLFKDNIKINLPQNKPIISGFTLLNTTNYGGNGVSCQVNFKLIFGGDVKSINLVRRGELAEYLGNSKKYIDLQTENSPYLFSYELHLEEGDNYLPIIVTDKTGNKVEYKMNIPASFTRRDKGIEINNDIVIY